MHKLVKMRYCNMPRDVAASCYKDGIMEIKSGETYKMRNGQAVVVLANDCEVRPWRDERCKYTWINDGCVFSKQSPTDFDLVGIANKKFNRRVKDALKAKAGNPVMIEPLYIIGEALLKTPKQLGML